MGSSTAGWFTDELRLLPAVGSRVESPSRDGLIGWSRTKQKARNGEKREKRKITLCASMSLRVQSLRLMFMSGDELEVKVKTGAGANADMVRAFFNINFRCDRLTTSIDIVYNTSMATSLVIEFNCSITSTLFRRTMVDHCRRKRRSHRDFPSLLSLR